MLNETDNGNDRISTQLKGRLLAGDIETLDPAEGRWLDDLLRGTLAALAGTSTEQVTMESKLLDDLSLDSLALLEFFEELQVRFDVELDVNALTAYAAGHPAETVGEFRDRLVAFLTSSAFREAVLRP